MRYFCVRTDCLHHKCVYNTVDPLQRSLGGAQKFDVIKIGQIFAVWLELSLQGQNLSRRMIDMNRFEDGVSIRAQWGDGKGVLTGNSASQHMHHPQTPNTKHIATTTIGGAKKFVISRIHFN